MNNQLFIVGGLFKVEKFEVVIKLSGCYFEEKFKEFCNHLFASHRAYLIFGNLPSSSMATSEPSLSQVFS